MIPAWVLGLGGAVALTASSYRVHDDLSYEAVVNREPLPTRWGRALDEGVEAVGADTPAGRRLSETAEFFAFLKAEMPAMLARWRAQR